MSTQAHAGKVTTRVIVRAYADEPVRLVAGRDFGKYIVVANEVTGTEIGFPLVHVYRDDETLYRALRRAYEAGEQDELRRLWGTAVGHSV